jgi:hypothetical protein
VVGGGSLFHGTMAAVVGGGSLFHGTMTAVVGGGSLFHGTMTAVVGGGSFPHGTAFAEHTDPRRTTTTPNFKAINLRGLIRLSPSGRHNRLGTLLCQSNPKCVGTLQQKCYERIFLTEVLIADGYG